MKIDAILYKLIRLQGWGPSCKGFLWWSESWIRQWRGMELWIDEALWSLLPHHRHVITIPLSSFRSKTDQLFYLKLEILSSLNHVRLGRVLRKMLGMRVIRILSSKIEWICLEKTSDNKSSGASGKSNSYWELELWVMVTCRLPGNYCIKLYMYVNELWNVGSGEG